MSPLFTPFTLGPLQLPNRVIIAPMCQYSAIDGLASDWHLIHYGGLALSGAGMLILEATAVSPEGRISPQDLGLWADPQEAALQEMIDRIRRLSSMPLAIQLAHAGRKASTAAPWEGGHQLRHDEKGWTTVAPSAIPYAETEQTPLELSCADMTRISNDFVKAAQRSVRLGLDAIEIHSAHGYLLHQFLSPLSNHRTDHYGGSLENRMRFGLEIHQAVREAVPSTIPVGMRISATDWAPGGWDLEQSIVYAKALAKQGLSFMDVSTGGLTPDQSIQAGPLFQVPFARRIREETGLATITVGMITHPADAEQIIRQEDADLVALARGIIHQPHWVWDAAARLGGQIDAPNPYLRCHPPSAPDIFRQSTL